MVCVLLDEHVSEYIDSKQESLLYVYKSKEIFSFASEFIGINIEHYLAIMFSDLYLYNV